MGLGFTVIRRSWCFIVTGKRKCSLGFHEFKAILIRILFARGTVLIWKNERRIEELMGLQSGRREICLEVVGTKPVSFGRKRISAIIFHFLKL